MNSPTDGPPEAFAVEEILVDNGRVTGIRGRAAMDGFVSVMAGTLPAPESFGPENVGRIMTHAAPPNV
ncbi:MAG: hypothetical protein JWO02_709 [Solirubrobacterales bacterium]|nr:hypothetical protein [Solirubrobacterales bacterium]